MGQILLSSLTYSQRENDKLKIVKSQLKLQSKNQRVSLSVLKEAVTSYSHRDDAAENQMQNLNVGY